MCFIKLVSMILLIDIDQALSDISPTLCSFFIVMITDYLDYIFKNRQMKGFERLAHWLIPKDLSLIFSNPFSKTLGENLSKKTSIWEEHSKIPHNALNPPNIEVS